MTYRKVNLLEPEIVNQAMTNTILNKLVSVKDEIGLCWLGNLSWLISFKGKLIAFDLDLETGMRIKKSPIGTSEIAHVLDYHFITHEHDDHFSSSTSGILAEYSKCTFIIPSNCVKKARDIGVPEERMIVAVPGNSFMLPELEVLPIRAIHGHKNLSILKTANFDDCGYKLMFGGKVFLQPGDSVLLEDHLDHKDVDVLFVSPTEHNMHIDRSVKLILELNPDYVYCQHFGSYRETEENKYWTKGYPDELKRSLPDRTDQNFITPEMGSLFFI